MAAALLAFYLLSELWRPGALYHDNLALGFPARILISTSYANGFLPLWDHWAGGGTALNSIYSSLAISPIVAGLSAFGRYSILGFKFEILLYNGLAVTGMYLWLRRVASAPAAIACALPYGLTTYMVFQAQLNIEATASAAMFPWIALGLHLCLTERVIGIPITAFSMMIAFTSGYLGMNVIGMEFLVPFSVALALAGRRWPSGSRESRWTQRALRAARPLAFIGAACLAAALLLNFLILETITNLSLEYFTERSVNTFTGSVRLASLWTLLDPTGANPFVTDGHGGNVSVLFVGVVPLIGLVFGFARRQASYLIGLFFAIITLLSTLSGQYGFARFLVRQIPFYANLRFHGWLSILVIFFLLTSASLGLDAFFKEEGRSSAVRGIGIVSTVILCALVLGLAADRVTPGGMLVVAGPLVVLAVLRLRLPGEALTQGAWFAAVLATLAIGSMTLAAIRVPELTWHRPDAEGRALAAAVEARATPGFPPPPSAERLPGDIGPDGTAVWGDRNYTKVPVVRAYQPQIHPSADALIRTGKEWTLRHMFILDGPGDPVPVEAKVGRLDPEAIDAEMLVPEHTTKVVWTSPFSDGWRARLDGHPIPLDEAADGLTVFELSPGRHRLELRYRPGHLVPSLALASLTALGLIGLLIGPVIRDLYRRRVTTRPEMTPP